MTLYSLYQLIRAILLLTLSCSLLLFLVADTQLYLRGFVRPSVFLSVRPPVRVDRVEKLKHRSVSNPISPLSSAPQGFCLYLCSLRLSFVVHISRILWFSGCNFDESWQSAYDGKFLKGNEVFHHTFCIIIRTKMKLECFQWTNFL